MLLSVSWKSITISDNGRINCNMVIFSSTALEGKGTPRRSMHSVVTDPRYFTGVIIVPRKNEVFYTVESL